VKTTKIANRHQDQYTIRTRMATNDCFSRHMAAHPCRSMMLGKCWSDAVPADLEGAPGRIRTCDTRFRKAHDPALRSCPLPAQTSLRCGPGGLIISRILHDARWNSGSTNLVTVRGPEGRPDRETRGVAPRQAATGQCIRKSPAEAVSWSLARFGRGTSVRPVSARPQSLLAVAGQPKTNRLSCYRFGTWTQASL
jgi:hypothetical protein